MTQWNRIEDSELNQQNCGHIILTKEENEAGKGKQIAVLVCLSCCNKARTMSHLQGERFISHQSLTSFMKGSRGKHGRHLQGGTEAESGGYWLVLHYFFSLLSHTA